MTRVEENKETIRIIHNEEIDIEDTAAINARMIVLLADISKSLAAISDDLSLKRDIEEQTRVYEQIGKREP